MSQSVNRKRHMNGLDGLRAIAVVGVIAYHLNLDFIPGGLLGVGIFFVLSGYLITDILLTQWHEHGRIALGDFWLRRFRRLLPGMLTLTVVVMLWLLCTDSSRLASLRGDIVSGITYISNWWYIYHNVSYFESFGPPSPFGHFWSLAVEEQFYLVWPILLIAAIVLFKRKGWLVVFIIVAAELSAGAMAIMYNPDLDPSRVYYGTDTRAFALLAGAALAVIWPSRKLSSGLSGMSRIVLDGCGLAALGVLIYMMLTTSEYDPFLYQGGMLLQTIAATVLVAVLAHPSSILAHIIGAKPFRWIGERSYGLYLWHYPVIVLTSPAVDTGDAHPVRMLLQVVATVFLASISLKYIENPIRYNGFRDSLSKLWGKGGVSFVPRHVWLKRTGLLMTLLLLCYSVSRMMLPVAANSDSHSVSLSTVLNGDKSAEEQGQDVMPATTKPVDSEQKNPVAQSDAESESEGGNVQQNQSGDRATPGSKPAKQDGKIQYTIIGDSVILDAKPYLEQNISGVYVDGHVGRQMWQAGDVLRELKSNKQLGSEVVLELGTNGSFNSKNLKSVLDGLEDKTRVYLVTVRVPRPWEHTVNKALTDAASSYSNVSLIDWNQASEGHDEYFEKDGVHLTVEGSKAFATLIKNSLQ
ncbi:O-acetyltransferase OatA [Paenibacillus sp. JJ-100]|uniref:acyltransferase family protein n=1 Tax=Paenibacillus sp. JJ-100 TaxID=2974896 RepID=UPI0022FF90F2|nr:acyltransferase family protein [Paenibacillus sp. JJ-100]CAI6028139.1 O-acetyltransferase OatA [Paenibacillus sp. JJ-100]